MNKKQAEQVIRILVDAGFEKTYFSGGCVRDSLLGLEPHDWDIATEATPDEVELTAACHNLKSLSTGKEYGVTFLIVDGIKVDVATFRKDVGSRDGRRPSHVEFTKSPEEDAQRRDFSCNGMFMDLGGTILDFVSGQVDIKAKLIRAIGDPTARLQEDYLRILRAIRFSARYSFTIEFELSQAIKANLDGLKLISRERIRDEVLQIIQYQKVSDKYASGAPVLWLGYVANAALLTPQRLPSNRDSVDYAIKHKYTPEEILCLYIEHLLPDAREDVLDLLKLSNEQKELCLKVLDMASSFTIWHDMTRQEKFDLLRQKYWRAALRVWNAGVRSFEYSMSKYKDVHSEVDTFYAVFEDEINAPSVITGETLIGMGFKPGQQFSIIIDRARKLQDSGIFATPTIKDIIKTCYGDLNVRKM